MLNKTELMLLERALADERVLSVYVDGTEANPAEQARWRLDLAHAVQKLRTALADAPHAERMEFDRCVEWVTRELAALPGSVGASAGSHSSPPTACSTPSGCRCRSPPWRCGRRGPPSPPTSRR